MTRYTAFGLEIDSELPLPWLLPGSERSPEVTIRLGTVPHHLTDPVGKGWYFEATPDSFLFLASRPESPFLIDELLDRLQEEIGDPVDATQNQEVG